MYTDVTIDGFRSLHHFELHRLGRINLLVGVNNGGKTSVLEAIHLLWSGRPALWPICTRRGEFDEREELEAQVSHLFHEHLLGPGAALTVAGENDGRVESVTLRIVEAEPAEAQRSGTKQTRLPLEGNSAPDLSIALEMVSSQQKDRSSTTFLTRHGTAPARSLVVRHTEQSRPVQFIGTQALDADEVIELFEQVVLTSEEKLVYDALRTLEPRLERLASLGARRYTRSGGRGGLYAKFTDANDRIPIGSMGEGTWRLLGLALSLIRAQNGILLVDEIDTGLHYSVMADMWKLVNATAERLSVQVFATTHSRDCYQSLAAISRDTVKEDTAVSIQRIDRGKQQAVAFSEAEIVIAAERGIEVR